MGRKKAFIYVAAKHAQSPIISLCYSINSHYLLLWGICIDSTSEDQVGKTVAIIVGVLAGLAVLIVLLSVCRKKMGKVSKYE